MYATTSTAPKNFVRPALFLGALLIGAIAIILTGYGTALFFIIPFSLIITTPLMAMLIMGDDTRPLLDGKPDPTPAHASMQDTTTPSKHRHIRHRPDSGSHTHAA